MTADPGGAGSEGRAPSAVVPRLDASHLSKRYGKASALRDVDLQVLPGELHGLVGQNGSGKSTLVKILSGYHAPSRGARALVDGVELPLPVRATDMHMHGIAVVHQTLGLFDHHTVLENVRAGRFRPTTLSRRIRWEEERERAAEVLRGLGRNLNLDASVGSLTAEDRATVAIARAMQDHPPGRGLIIFDESTRSLGRDALERFYELLRTVLATGAAALVVSHRLEEVLSVTDRLTVIRDGAVVESGVPTKSLTEAALIRSILGYQPERPTRTSPGGQRAHGEPIATASGLTGSLVSDLALTIHSGEVVGLTGLVGSGFEEIPYLLSGARQASRGELLVGDKVFNLAHGGGCRDFIAAGVALVPEERERAGLALHLGMLENMTLPRVHTRGSAVRIGRGWQEREVRSMIHRLGIRPPLPDMPVGRLSGGNQQKVLLGKWLAGAPALLLLCEPAQGVDVGARHDIVVALDEVAADGCAVVVASTDAQLLVSTCDRILVFRDGAMLVELPGGASQDEVIEATFREARLTPP